MEIEYSYTQSAAAALNVEDYGNCAIEANNDDGFFWYLVVDTALGWTRVLEFGPVSIDKEELPETFNCSYSRFEFRGPKIVKTIDKFLNRETKHLLPISQAREVGRDSALDHCPVFPQYMRSELF